MRKRSKYRPKPVNFNAIEHALESVSPLPTYHANHLSELKIRNHLAMQALTKGEATKRDMDVLIAMENIMDAFRRMEICTPLADEIAQGRRALIDIAVRAVSKLKFLATGPEIVALNTLMELHDELIPHITVTQMEQGIALAKRIIQKGHATVLPDVEQVMELMK
jgi:lysyl-tRNA synthetase class II